MTNEINKARIVVLGGAESGVGAAVLAKVKGFDVFLSDCGTIKEEYASTLREWNIQFEEGGHSENLILNADEVVKSPGIPETAPMIQALRAQGTHIVSEIEFASRYDNAKKSASPVPTERRPLLPLYTICSRKPGSTRASAAT